MYIIKLGSLYNLKIYLTKDLVTKIVLIKSIGIIYHIFIRRSTTTIIFINLLLLGKSTIKLIKILRHFCIKLVIVKVFLISLYKKSFYKYIFCILKHTFIYSRVL